MTNLSAPTQQGITDIAGLEEDVERVAEAVANWGRPRHEIGLK
jgi:hypothetical protein